MCVRVHISYAPVVALLTGETLQMVHVTLGTHDHLKGRYHFVAGRTVARRSEQPIKLSQNHSHTILNPSPVSIIFDPYRK